MPRPCQVTFHDLDAVRHSVRVEAESVYEAACLAVRALRKAKFIDQLDPGSRFEGQVVEPVVTHEVTLGRSNGGWRSGRAIRMS